MAPEQAAVHCKGRGIDERRERRWQLLHAEARARRVGEGDAGLGPKTLRTPPCCSFSSRTCVHAPLSFQYPAEHVVHATS